MPLRHWKHQHRVRLQYAQSLKELLHIALDVLTIIPEPRVMVCGPKSTGKKPEAHNNMVLKATIIQLTNCGHNIFNDFPLHERAKEIEADWRSQVGDSLDISLHEELYVPLLRSSLINEFYFISGWRKSTGATIVHDEVSRHKFQRHYLPSKWEDIVKHLFLDEYVTGIPNKIPKVTLPSNTQVGIIRV